MRMFAILTIALMMTFGLSACGQKGPLYLPQPEENSSETQP